MTTVEVETTVRLPPPEVFDFLVAFPRYADYSQYLRGVEQSGDGGAGTEYRLRFAWWKLDHTAHTRVTRVERPSRIDWETTKDVDAHGSWEVEPMPVDGGHCASRVRFVVTYEPGSVDSTVVELPALVSLDWVVGEVTGLIESEGRRVVERVVADLEGDPRPVELDVRVR